MERVCEMEVVNVERKTATAREESKQKRRKKTQPKNYGEEKYTLFNQFIKLVVFRVLHSIKYIYIYLYVWCRRTLRHKCANFSHIFARWIHTENGITAIEQRMIAEYHVSAKLYSVSAVRFCFCIVCDVVGFVLASVWFACACKCVWWIRCRYMWAPSDTQWTELNAKANPLAIRTEQRCTVRYSLSVLTARTYLHLHSARSLCNQRGVNWQGSEWTRARIWSIFEPALLHCQTLNRKNQ